MSSRQPILVVEDDEDIADIVQIIFAARGDPVIVAADGQRALDVLAALGPERRPRVIVLDMIMPVLDGLEFMRRYRAKPGPHAPIVAYSALEPYLVQAAALGATATVRKPFAVDTLVEAVDAAAAGKPSARSDAATADAGPSADARRVREISALGLDTPALNAALEPFLAQVAATFDVPLALVSIITDTRQYWSSGFGIPPDLLESRGTDVHDSFCVHAVAARSPLVVQNAVENPFFANNVMVRARGVRFYAGVPLFTRTGDAVGTLCIIDLRPRIFTRHDLALLRAFAGRVMGEIERRERLVRGDGPDGSFVYAGYTDHELGILGRTAFLEVLTAQTRRLAGRGSRVTLLLVSLPPDELRAGVATLGRLYGWCGRLGATRIGALAVDQTPDVARAHARDALGPHAAVVAVSASALVRDGLSVVHDAEAQLAALAPVA